MRTTFPMRRRWRPFACVAVWVGCLGGAVWLYLEAGGPVEAVAIAETKSYRVASARLGRLTALEVVEGQLVNAGNVVARVETRTLENDYAALIQAASEENPEANPKGALRAAATSYVSAIHARPGDVVTPGQPVLTLVEAQPRQVVAWLDERRGASLQPGAKVVVRRRAGHREQIAATVAGVGGDVATLPQRLWTNPHVPAWGRAVYIELPAGAAIAPGEILDILRPEVAAGAAQLLGRLRSVQASAP